MLQSNQELFLRNAIDSVIAGRLDRRIFLSQLVNSGVSFATAAQLLMHAGPAQAQPSYRSSYRPNKRGGGGALRLLWWQGPTLLNPHFATGVKDNDGSRIFYEPLATWDSDGHLIPILAAEIPSVASKTLASDGKWVIWKLKQNVKWHDGKSFTADDVVFNANFASDPATAAVTQGFFRGLRFTALDAFTVKVENDRRSPFWAEHASVMIVPKHHFENFSGSRARDAPANYKPIGTGPYKFGDFKPGDMVRGTINMDYHQPNRPHFDTIEMKGGGDAVSAARAVLQTGEFDFAWNLLVEDEILKRLENGGKGRVVITPGGNVEFVQLNSSDPAVEFEGERSHPKSRHPILSDSAVRSALGHLVDRQSIQTFIYGRTGIQTTNFVNNPQRFVSGQFRTSFNVELAAEKLEASGWKRSPDGIRQKDGKRLKLMLQTSINAPRQKTQQVIKQAAQKVGIELELKSIVASVFFSADIANPDTFSKFYADLQMYSFTMGQPDPERFMDQFLSSEVSSKANRWQGRNVARWVSREYDLTFKTAESEMDPIRRASLFMKMNDLVVGDNVVIPIVTRPSVSGVSTKLHAPISAWASNLWMIHDWYREV